MSAGYVVEPVSESSVQGFCYIFKGNARSRGVWNKTTNKVRTEHDGHNINHFKDHLNGVEGTGAVPIMDDENCVFAVLDLDNHKRKVDLDILEINRIIAAHKLPLIPCRSKSGGVHCYMFFSEPVPAIRIRMAIGVWQKLFEMPVSDGIDLFPKQDHLEKTEDGGRAYGNWINLPYFDATDTNRYAVDKAGLKLGLDEFIAYVLASRITAEKLEDILAHDHVEAPPCVQRMIQGGVDLGSRNMALYNITVYMKKAFPESYAPMVLDLNQKIFARAIPIEEAKRTIKSAGRRDYRYKCQDEPCKSLCDSKVCVKRLYGITPEDRDEMNNAMDLPEFTGLIKYDTDPPRWSFKMGEKLLEGVNTEELFSFTMLRKAVASKLCVHIPNMSANRWDKILAEMFTTVTTVEVPKETSANGQAVTRLVEYLEKAVSRIMDGYDIEREHEKLSRGMPCVLIENGEQYGAFRMSDFVKHLKSTRSEDLKGANLYYALRDGLDIRDMVTEVKGKKVSVWGVKVSKLSKVAAAPHVFTPEF